MSEVYGIPIEWYGDSLIVEMWLDGPAQSLFCRLLLDTGATHLGLLETVIEALGLEVAVSAAFMSSLGSGESHNVSLYHLPATRLKAIHRFNLLVIPVRLPEVSGCHGVLGMNWLRTFAHIALVHLQTDRPILELHDPA